ncbi:hypothetical protein LTR62_000153 [Meristemomyces frigidus]|uniref:Xylanolytic transcriptional activator regulatory domain-containing protein n=1 Tax=Meristemomyces frigidus TaxID=1508187 RepID=A0AAN7YL25_9PEZI|nr:hypothetical protein LTR62_000153 [Meristemomyces frigidus]
MTNTTSARPKNGRRESVSGASVTGSNRVRKNSMANGHSGGVGGPGSGHRPRAATISHIDLSSLGLMGGTGPQLTRMQALGLNGGHLGHHGMPSNMNFDYRGMSNSVGNHGNIHGLPKLDMSGINTFNPSDSLRTAPPMGGWNASFAQSTGFDLEQLFSPAATVNPAQLQFGGPISATSQFPNYEAFSSQHPVIQEADDYGWMRNWNMQIPAGNEIHEQAIDESSSSRMSSGGSPAGFSDHMSHSTPAILMPANDFAWSQADMQTTHPMSAGGPFHLGALGNGLPHLDMANATISPSILHDPMATNGTYFDPAMLSQPSPQPLQQRQTDVMPTVMHQSHGSNFFTAPSLSNFSSDSPSMSSSSARQSSVTSYSTDSITDATRQALLSSLSQHSVFGGHNHRKYSLPSVSSPLSSTGRRTSAQGPSLPSTADIRRYVDAFIHFAHPHLPFIHIPTLSFDTVELGNSARGNGSPINGGGCLVLAVAAIGALYEYDHPASRELFEAAKKMIGLYLEERRRADMTAAVNGHDSSAPHTPLWLVHAMLLNVIYGHQCGDKTAADIASTHCAALVSLARAAHLAQPPSSASSPDGDVCMGDAQDMSSHVSPGKDTSVHRQWIAWKTVEGRKRTLFAIFILSSLLTTAYNQPPTIMNSEITLDLPCDEELWSAETSQEWYNRGGAAAADDTAVPFVDALSSLLTANQRKGSSQTVHHSSNPLGSLQAIDGTVDQDLTPSTFGCLVLINALHNYIWETRTRHQGRQWTQQETDSMFSHIEPALNAWQAAWKSNPRHKLERPNPFGLGPLSADSIPLLDLAFVRLFVDLGRTKEAFWQRDFDAMAEELANGTDIVLHAAGSPNGVAAEDFKSSSGIEKRRPSQAPATDHSSSRRERHLRKAAFYAADSLTIACSYNLTYADMTSHELPVNSAMCFFDCSQVLAEWASTVQERVGKYLGVLGRGAIDYTAVPAIMLLETEDVELLRKIERICESLETKRFQQENLLALDMQQMVPHAAAMHNSAMHNNVQLNSCGFGSKILRVTAMMLEKAVVWPVTHVFAKALETQAMHMDRRAEASTS